MKKETKEGLMAAGGLLMMGIAAARAGKKEWESNKRNWEVWQVRKAEEAEARELRERIGSDPWAIEAANRTLAGMAAKGQAARAGMYGSPPTVPGAGYGADFGFGMSSGKQVYEDRRLLGDKD